MARECAAGKGRALVRPGGRTRSRWVQESPAYSPHLGTPRCPREHTFPLALWGWSVSSNLSTSEDPDPSALGRTLEKQPPDLLLRPPTPSPLAYIRFWGPRPLGPCPNRRPRMKILSEGLQYPGPQPLSTVERRNQGCQSLMSWGNRSLCLALAFSQ